MKWIATIPLVIEAADLTREQIIEFLIYHRIIRGPSDPFTLEQVEEVGVEVAAIELKNEVRNEQQNFEP
jgi:hypothetical protein